MIQNRILLVIKIKAASVYRSSISGASFGEKNARRAFALRANPLKVAETPGSEAQSAALSGMEELCA
jgi:hypothetical protein